MGVLGTHSGVNFLKHLFWGAKIKAPANFFIWNPLVSICNLYVNCSKRLWAFHGENSFLMIFLLFSEKRHGVTCSFLVTCFGKSWKHLVEKCAGHVIKGLKWIKLRKKNWANFFHHLSKTSRCDINQFFRLTRMFFLREATSECL